MATREEVLEFFEASKETYRFLSQVFFKELNEEAIFELAQAEWPSNTGNEHLDRGYELVRRYFKFADLDKRGQLAVEYARVFLAAGVFSREKRTAVPYESVFTDEEHVVMGAARDKVVRCFAANGFQVNAELHEPEDHLSFELEFCQHMSEKAAALLQAGERKGFLACASSQLEFIEEHPLSWIAQLQQVAEGYAKTTFYTGMLLVAQGALEQSAEMLREIIEHVPAEEA